MQTFWQHESTLGQRYEYLGYKNYIHLSKYIVDLSAWKIEAGEAALKLHMPFFPEVVFKSRQINKWTDISKSCWANDSGVCSVLFLLFSSTGKWEQCPVVQNGIDYTRDLPCTFALSLLPFGQTKHELEWFHYISLTKEGRRWDVQNFYVEVLDSNLATIQTRVDLFLFLQLISMPKTAILSTFLE